MTDQEKIAAKLAECPTLAVGIGSYTEPCTIAAINIALTGKLTDETPDCASPVICSWVRKVQDNCPPNLGRDNPSWRFAVPMIAGTRKWRDEDGQRLTIILKWMWDAIGDNDISEFIPDHARVKWNKMLRDKTSAAAFDASYALSKIDSQESNIIALAIVDAGDAVNYAIASGDDTNEPNYSMLCANEAALKAAKAVVVAARYASYHVATSDNIFVNPYWERRDLPNMLQKLCSV